mgnify:CR=1 FL=1
MNSALRKLRDKQKKYQKLKQILYFIAQLTACAFGAVMLYIFMVLILAMQPVNGGF